jgi:hypothetical protein
MTVGSKQAHCRQQAMSEPLLLSDAQQVIGRRWLEEPAPRQARLLGVARDALDFISLTGQWYSFLDFREGRELGGSRANNEEESQGPGEAERFFRELLDEPSAVDERTGLLTILDALRFISVTRQQGAFEAFVQRVVSHAPPLVVASFDTQAQADAWLQGHPSPPAFANVLIGDRYHDVVYDRETNFRRLPWNRDLERYLGWLEREDPPVASASFATRAEAESWLHEQAHPSPRAWVLIAGAFHLAVYHSNVNRRALYPLSSARRDAAGAG